MADAKITALTELTDIDKDDLLPVIDDPAGTPVTKKIKAKNAQMGAWLFKFLDSDDTGANSASAQPWFPTAGAVAVEASTTYIFDGLLYLVRSAGTTSHTTSVVFAGTATITRLNLLAECKEGDTSAQADWDGAWMPSATAVVVKAASTSASENAIIAVRGSFKVNAAGTFIPQFQYSSAPGGAPTVKAGSYFRLLRLDSNVRGTWS